MNAREQLKFELAYFDITVEYISHYVTRDSPTHLINKNQEREMILTKFWFSLDEWNLIGNMLWIANNIIHSL